MKLMKLTATRPHTYGTRHLVAGEEYEAPPRHAAALVAGRKAKFAARMRKPEPPQEMTAAVPVPEQDARVLELEALRAQAAELGVDVDRRWGLARLQFEIAQASK